jgi:hypothetical protein
VPRAIAWLAACPAAVSSSFWWIERLRIVWHSH